MQPELRWMLRPFKWNLYCSWIMTWQYYKEVWNVKTTLYGRPHMQILWHGIIKTMKLFYVFMESCSFISSHSFCHAMRVPLASKICHTKSILLHHNKYHLVKTTLISTKKCVEKHIESIKWSVLSIYPT
jgi:hypothetical protein